MLHGARFDNDVVELPELALVRKAPLRRPRLPQKSARLVEAGGGLFGRNGETVEFLGAVALADAEIDATARQQIDGRDLFGEQSRVVPGQYDDCGAKAYPSGRAG